MIVSFMSANYVAREVGFHLTGGWGQGERSTSEAFEPIETFPRRFGQLLQTVRWLGFEAIDVWTAHLNPAWATHKHIDTARDLLGRHGLAVASLAGGFGKTGQELERTCQLAQALGTQVLGGSSPYLTEHRPESVALLERYDLRLGIENHPETSTLEAMLAAIGDGGNGRVGTTVDTGWYGTVGRDAAAAIRQLGGHLFHVHLKDVLAAGSHETCRYGRGVVPVEECVRALQEIGYQGAISIEHEPESFDPTEDCKANLAMLRAWL
jgi:sugar phosphate isomerase/epimerase